MSTLIRETEFRSLISDREELKTELTIIWASIKPLAWETWWQKFELFRVPGKDVKLRTLKIPEMYSEKVFCTI